MAGAEGSGLISGITRVGPPLQPTQGKFDEKILESLDLLLYEMGKRDLKAVIFLSNNWEWSGGFQQYLIWNNRVPKELETRKLTWDEQRDIVSPFYGCGPCKTAYDKQVDLILDRTNKFNGKKYADDPAIMAWELANEPRPMRPAAENDYKKWIAGTAARIKAKDKNHLVGIGHEGWIGTEGMKLFEEIHADKNIDYLTIHIWAKNWNWFENGKLYENFPKAVEKTDDVHQRPSRRRAKTQQTARHRRIRFAARSRNCSTSILRPFCAMNIMKKIFERLAISAGANGNLAGVNFWAFGGTSRPVKGQPFWQKGDDYSGDPPMEEQGLNSVFVGNVTTWNVIKNILKCSESDGVSTGNAVTG